MGERTSRSIGRALLLSLSVGAVAVPIPVSAQQPCIWEIGVMGALSGDYGYLGQPILDGIEMAAAEANSGGELECTLEVVAQDSQGDPSQAVPLARDLAERERLVACMCGFFSGETLATGSIFEREGILMASTGSHPAVDDQGFGTWFRVVANDMDVARRGAVYVKQVLRPRKVVLVRDRQDYSMRVTRLLRRALSWRVKKVLVIDTAQVDHSRQVARTREIRPDLVIFGGYAPDAGRFVRQLRQGGVESQYMVSNAVDDRSFDEVAGRHARGALGMCNCSYPGSLGEPAEGFAERFEARFGRPPRSYAGDMYDVMSIVTEVLPQHTELTPIETIRDSIVEHFDAARREQGVIKPYTWERDGDLRARGRHVFIFRHGRERWRMRGSVYELVRD